MQIRDDGTYSLIALDSASYTGPNWTAPMPRFGSSERAIPDGNDDDELLFPSIVVVVASIVMGLQPQASQRTDLSLHPEGQ